MPVHAVEALYAAVHQHVLRDVVLRRFVVKVDRDGAAGLRVEVLQDGGFCSARDFLAKPPARLALTIL